MHRPRHDLLTQSLHWITAFVVIGAYSSALVFGSLPRGPERAQILGNHMSLGAIVFGLTSLRLLWRIWAPSPTPLAHAVYVSFLAKATHIALYVAMLAVPAIGITMVWARGRGIGVFGFFTIPPLIAPNPELAAFMNAIHENAAHILIALSGVHAVAAILHHTWFKDGTLIRMLPRLRPRNP